MTGGLGDGIPNEIPTDRVDGAQKHSDLVRDERRHFFAPYGVVRIRTVISQSFEIDRVGIGQSEIFGKV